eukprot:scaffold513523_cov19-Prasinocladus_malaysianus.AAC.1
MASRLDATAVSSSLDNEARISAPEKVSRAARRALDRASIYTAAKTDQANLSMVSTSEGVILWENMVATLTNEQMDSNNGAADTCA